MYALSNQFDKIRAHTVQLQRQINDFLEIDQESKNILVSTRYVWNFLGKCLVSFTPRNCLLEAQCKIYIQGVW